MIISASRRTDIPAFYSDWFIKRLEEGFVLVRNPVNAHLISRISLKTEVVDFIVFWTKNPENMLSRLGCLNNFHIPYYFLFTVTSYGQSLEKKLPSKSVIIDTFKRLSDKIGKERVIWRYDPVLLTPEIDLNYHRRFFEFTVKKLEGYTDRCIVSFLDMYKKCRKNLKGFNVIDLDDDKMREIGAVISQIARSYNIQVQTCAEEIDLSGWGITRGKCIDDALISKITGRKTTSKKDKSQRAACNCVESADIGSYNTCIHNCLYCYANFDHTIAGKNYASHNPDSPILIGNIEKTDRIVERKAAGCVNHQNELF